MQVLQEFVERFIAGAVQPAVLDPGEEPLALIPGQWSVSQWNGRLVLQAWDADRNLVRKIARLKEERRDRISLITERFPRTEGELQIADLAAPGARDIERKTCRMAFRERFKLMLSREYPGWRMDEVSAEANLAQSLSASYARSFLRMGSTGIAVMSAAPDSPDCAGIVSFGLIWLDYLRRREKGFTIGTLLLYVPVHAANAVGLRARWIDPARVDCRLFAYDERDRAGAIDFSDAGNVESILPPCLRPVRPNSEATPLPGMPDDVTRIAQADGTISLRVRGMEFARISHEGIECGIGKRTRSNMRAAATLGCELARIRNPENADTQHSLYTANPEEWLEANVRTHPEAIDASLCREPLYGQVPIFTGSDRGIIDLLGIDNSGRLVVIELKATADLHLPFQALDYWLRVSKHLQAGDFERLGYFPGHVIRRDTPRIILVAPALEFHSTTEVILAALMPSIAFMRIGLAADWRKSLRAMFRLRGSERP